MLQLFLFLLRTVFGRANGEEICSRLVRVGVERTLPRRAAKANGHLLFHEISFEFIFTDDTSAWRTPLNAFVVYIVLCNLLLHYHVPVSVIFIVDIKCVLFAAFARSSRSRQNLCRHQLTALGEKKKTRADER